MDLMMPGDGTPWEDRGNLGLPKAFIQTAVSSVTKPARLLDHIRRPDTAGEATQFAMGCAVLWVISTFVHMLLWHWRHPLPELWEMEGTYYIKSVIASLLVGAAAYVLGVLFASRLFRTMVSSELEEQRPAGAAAQRLLLLPGAQHSRVDPAHWPAARSGVHPDRLVLSRRQAAVRQLARLDRRGHSRDADFPCDRGRGGVHPEPGHVDRRAGVHPPRRARRRKSCRS
jgi:hypothetical protein